MPARRAIARPFHPRQVSGLVADFDPVQYGLNDGAAITRFNDASGNGNHAGGTATYKTNIFNGRPAVRFNGTSNSMSTANVNLAHTASVVIFLVATAASTGDQVFCEFSTNYNSFTDGFLLYRATSNIVAMALKGNVGINSFDSHRTMTTRAELVTATFDKSYPQSGGPNTNATDYRETFGSIGGVQMNGTNGWTNANNNTNNFGTRVLYIGTRNASSLWLNGDIGRLLVYDRLLSFAERAKIARNLTRLYGLRHTSGTLACIGDSTTGGANATNPYPSQLAALLVTDGYDYNYGNYGMNGWTLQSMVTGGMFDRAIPPSGIDGGKNIAILQGGSNDMSSPGSNQSAATTYTRLGTAIDILKANGYKTIVNTCLARTDAAAPGDFETKRQAYNTSVVANTAGADVVVNCASDVRLDDGTGTLPVAVDSGDLAHLNNTGLGYLAALFKTAVVSL